MGYLGIILDGNGEEIEGYLLYLKIYQIIGTPLMNLKEKAMNAKKKTILKHKLKSNK